MENLLKRRVKDTLQIPNPRIRLLVFGTQEGNLLRCYVKDTDFILGDKVAFFLENEKGFLAINKNDGDYYTIKKNGRIDIAKDVLVSICEITKAKYPQLDNPSCISLKKVSEKKWMLM